MCLCQGIDTRRLALAISGDTTETEALQTYFVNGKNIKETLAYIGYLQTRQVYGDKL